MMKQPAISLGIDASDLPPDSVEDGCFQEAQLDSPPLTPARAERKPLRVAFQDMEDEKEEAENIVKEIENDLFHLSKVGTGSIRFRETRFSLLGKPLNYHRAHRRDVRYRRLQSRIYNFLERPKDWMAVVYHILV